MAKTLDEILTSERWTNANLSRRFQREGSYISVQAINAHRRRVKEPSPANKAMYKKILETNEIDFSLNPKER